VDVAGYGQNCRPALARFLYAIGLDAVYEQASGDRLWRRKGGELIEVLDLVGGFGANLFGHHHPELVAEMQAVLARKTPVLAQGSYRMGAARLAEALRRRVGDYIVILTNSGAETVEAALKHATLEMGRPLFWALRGAFHGKTTGAIQLTERYREPFTGLGPEVRFLNPWDQNDWAAAEADVDRVCAAFIEPVAGEGGIHPIPEPFLDWLWRCSQHLGFPLVADEIQSGMGRTGTFLAIEQYGIQPDYVCLSKALGGGLTKIGALLIRRERFVEEFSLKHTSTFAEDDLSCAVALKALEVLERDGLPEACRAKGAWFLEELRRLCARYPEQLAAARGCGLMVGLELRDQSGSPSNGISMLSQQEFLGYLASAYLLNTHAIRVVPTLSSPLTLRIEPSAYVSEPDLSRFVRAMATFCEAIANADFAHLTSFLVERPPAPARDYRVIRLSRREPAQAPAKVGFIGHLLMPAHAALWDPSLSVWSEQELEILMARPSRALGPALFEQVNVRSATGAAVHLSYYGLDVTPAQIMDAMRSRDARWIHENIEAAVRMARDQGCQVVGLGGYTSIVTGNCKRIRVDGVGLTSGNALTVGVGLAVLREAAEERGIRLSDARVAIVGATGNIGSTYAGMIAPEAGSVLLVARELGAPRLAQVIAEIRASAPGARVEVTDRMDDLRECPLIVCASNSPVPLVYPRHLPGGSAIICDIAVPGDTAPEVAEERPDVLLLEGGAVQLPDNPDFSIAGLPLPPGQTYACVAETLLMGLEGERGHGTFGAVTTAGVRKALDAARKHGFRFSLLVSTPTL
jgi:acetylornithine/succinyldiaminopimelate/putrescine aminotransferase/predicted amino acid dehydrogenase